MEPGRTSPHGLTTQITLLLAFKDKITGRWIPGYEPAKLNVNSGHLDKSREQYASVSNIDKLPRQVIANLFHLKCQLWLTVEIQNIVYVWHFEAESMLRRVPASICNVCQGGRNMLRVSWPAISHPFPEWSGLTEKKLTATSLLLDMNDITKESNRWRSQWHKISVFKI